MVGAYTPANRIWRVAAAFGLGILSHVVLDAIPHSDYRMLSPSNILWVSACETVIACAIVAFLLRRRLPPRWPGLLLAGLAGSSLPDVKFPVRVIAPGSFARSVEHYGDHLHSYFHAADMANPFVGLAIEFTVALALLATLLLFPRTSVPG